MFNDTEIRVTLSERMESPLGGEAFIGTVSGYDGVKNAVVLQTDDGLTVDIQDFVRNRTYTIISDASGVTVKEIDPSAATVTPTVPIDPGLPQKSSAPRLLSAPLDTALTDQPNTIVDILVAYDIPSAAWVRQNGGGITNFATMAVQKMNTVLDNSGFASTFRYRLVGVMTVNANGGNDFTNVLEAVRYGKGNWAPVKSMRDKVGADIVTTLIDTGSAEGSNGLSYSLNSSYSSFSAFSESAYNVCAVRAVAQGHVMTHEVGHNIGAGHATAVADEGDRGPQLYDYSAGYYFIGTNGVAYHTIMAYNSDGYGNHYKSAPFFSSPDFTYMGTAVGDEKHDNVRTIQQTYGAASQWRKQKVPTSYDVFFSPEAGSLFTDSITVALTPGKHGTEIRYTLDGSTPTVSSTLYTEPITFTQTTTIRAITVTDGVAGPVFEATYSVSDIGTAVDAPQLAWRTSDTHPWTFQTTDTYDGIGAVQSMDDGAWYGNESWLETTVTGPTAMSFRYKTRKGTATFSVLVDGTAVLTDTKDTTADIWTLQEIAIPQGVHTVRFLFQCWVDKLDGWSSARYDGFNGAWLDTVQFDALSRPPTISPATTADESSATTFQGNYTVTLTPPANRTGFLYYTLDGSDPTGEAQLLYEGPIVLTKSTRVRAVFVEGGKEPSVEVGGLYLERHPVSPGEWTTDVDGVKAAAAAQNGRLIAVLLADRAGCWYSQRFYTVAESPEFLAWAKANGIYLVTGDVSCNADAQTARNWFWSLCDQPRATTPSMYFVRPDAPGRPIAQGIAINDGYSTIGRKLYLDTVESLIAGFASILDESVPEAPTCSLTDSLVESFPVYVTLTHQNTAGDIYYTLDGSMPTTANGIPYQYGTTIPIEKASQLTAMVWRPDGGLSSGAYVGKIKAIDDVLGTSGITWSRSGTGSWREGDEPGTLRAGGLNSDTYTATLQATVKGKGKLVFTYAFNSWTSKNTFEFKANGRQQFSNAYNGSSITFSGAITNEVSSDTTTTYTWTYTVADASRDFGSLYVSQAGVWLSNVQWIPAIPVNICGIADPADGGKVTGGGPCAPGKAVTLKAAASKNFSFVGWSKVPANVEQGTESSIVATTATLVIDRSAKPAANSSTSTTITDVTGDATYYALFKSYPEVFVIVDSTNGGAEPTGSGAGKYVAGTVTGMGKYAPGKTKIALKATANKNFVFAGWYANADDDEPLTRNATYTIAIMGEADVRYTAKFITAEEDKEEIGLEVNGAKMSGAQTSKPTWTNFCGVAVNWPVISSGLSDTTVKVAGLPSGLKLVQDKVTKAYTIAGAPSAASKIAKNGLVTPSSVVFTVTTAGKSTQTFAMDLYVVALPAWAIGSFDGAVRSSNTATASLIGSVSMAVAASGKITGKAMIGGTNWTFKADAISAVECPMSNAAATSGTVTTNFILNATATAGKATLPLDLSIAAFAYDDLPSSATSCAAGTFGGDDATLYRVIWSDKADTSAASLIARHAGAYSFAVTYGRIAGNVAFTLDEKGSAKGAATLPDGDKTRSASFSANALVEEDGLHVVVAIAPDAKKGYAALYEDRLLVPHSGNATDDRAFRDPGFIAVTAPFYLDSTASGTVAVTPKYGQIDAGKTVTLKAAAAKGSVFAGWFDGTVLLSQTSSFALPAPDGDKTITAMFITTDEDKRNITLRVNGAQLSGSTTEKPIWSIFCGVAVNWPVISSGLSATTVKVSGLPSGLKLVQDKVTKAYTVAGTPSAASKVDKNGVVTPSQVVFAVTTAGKSTQTFALDLYVEALPPWATGNFDGAMLNGGRGTVSLTIAANGKISGKLLRDDGTWKLAADSFALYASDAYLATVVGKNGKIAETYDVTVTASTALQSDNVGMVKAHTARPTSGTEDSSVQGIEWTAVQNLWKRADTKVKMPTFTKSIDLPLDLGDAGDMNNSLNLTFKKDGVVAFAGKVNGVKMSGSSQLVPTDDGWQVTIYAPPKASIPGFCKTIAVSVDTDGTISKVEVKQ